VEICNLNKLVVEMHTAPRQAAVAAMLNWPNLIFQTGARRRQDVVEPELDLRTADSLCTRQLPVCKTSLRLVH
jgi:hypothetical protein